MCYNVGVVSSLGVRYTWSTTWRIYRAGPFREAPQFIQDMCDLIPVPGIPALCKRYFKYANQMQYWQARAALIKKKCLAFTQYYSPLGTYNRYAAVTCTS